MRTWHLYLIRPGFRAAFARAYADSGAVPGRWVRRAKYLGPLPCPTRVMAERLAVVLGWKRDHGRLPRLETA